MRSAIRVSITYMPLKMPYIHPKYFIRLIFHLKESTRETRGENARERGGKNPKGINSLNATIQI